MTIRTAKQLIDSLAECTECGKEHKLWQRDPKPVAPSWASPIDGHPYKSRLYALTNSGQATKTIEIMRQLVRES